MGKVANEKIEKKAINALENIIDNHQAMSYGFNSMDKEIAWDGYISIFKDDKYEHSKKNWDDKLPIQIKGHLDIEMLYINKQIITYSVDLEDLNIYFNDRGVLYFQIFMSEDGERREIFYSSLFPSKIKKYLETAARKGNKKSINIPFTKLEQTTDKLYVVAKQFSNESRMQGFGTGQTVQNTIKLKDIDKISSISASVVGASNEFEFIKRLGDGDVCLYGKKEGSSFVAPIEWNDNGIYFMKKEFTNDVLIGDKIYYKKYEIHLDSNGNKSLILSRNLQVDLKTFSFYFKPQTNIAEIRNDAEFSMALMKSTSLTVGQTICSIKDFEMPEVLKNKLNFYIELDDTLKMIEFDYRKDVSDMSQEMLGELFELVAMRKGYRNKLLSEKIHIYNWKIENKYMPVVVYRHENDDENDLLNAIYTRKQQTLITNNQSEYYKVPMFTYLDNKILSNLYNYNYEYFREQIDDSDFNEDTAEALNFAALALIHIYDNNCDVKLLELAMYLLKKLNAKESKNINCLINIMQIKKRNGTFSLRDSKKLNEIFSDDIQIRCAINILLNNRDKAVYYYQQMDEETKKNFDDFPIYNLYNLLIATN